MLHKLQHRRASWFLATTFAISQRKIGYRYLSIYPWREPEIRNGSLNIRLFRFVRPLLYVYRSSINNRRKYAPLTFLLFSLQAYSYARTRVFKKGGTNFAYRYNGRKGNLTLWYFIFLLSPGCYCFFNQVSLVTVSLDSSTTVPDPFFSRDYVSFFP